MSTTDNQIVRIHDMVKTFGSWDEWDRLVSAMSDQYGSYVGPATNTSADPNTWQSWNNSTSVSSSNFDGRLCPDKHAWQWVNNYTAGSFKVDEDNSLLSNQLVPNEKLVWVPLSSENSLRLKYEGNILSQSGNFNVPYQGGTYKINVFYTNASDYEVTPNIIVNSGSGSGSGSSIGGDDTTDSTDSYVTIEKNKNHIILTVPRNRGTTILGHLTFSVTHNDGTTTTRILFFSQAGFSFYTVPNNVNLKFPSNESSQNTTIVHSGPWEIFFKPSWVTVSPAYCNDYVSDKETSLPNITETVSITCQSFTENRKGTVIFRSEGKDVYATIEQTVDPMIVFYYDNNILILDRISFGTSGGTKKVTVETLNISELTLDETTIPDWFTIERNKNEFTISVSSNLGGGKSSDLRFVGTGYNGDIISKVLTVKQTGASISIIPMNMSRGFGYFRIVSKEVTILNSTSSSYKITGNSAVFNYRVNCPAGVPWKIVQKPDWVHMDQMYGTNTASSNVRGSVYPFIYVEPNYSNAQRTGTITVCLENGSTSDHFTIKQNSGQVVDTYVDPHVTYVTQEGGVFNKSFSKTNASSWGAMSNSGWASTIGQFTPAGGNFTNANTLSVNIKPGANKSTWDVLAWIDISPNRAGTNRNAAIFNIKGTNPAHSFHPEESPSEPEPETPNYSLSISKTSWAAAQTVSSTTLDVTAIGPWKATSNADWLTVSPSTGVGDEEEPISTVTVSAAENTSTSTRTGRITFTCGDSTTSLTKILTVTQDAYVPPTDSISLSKTSWTASNSASETTVTVTSSGTWTASANQSWISVAPSIGPSGRTVQIAITANSTTSSRNGTVTFECGNAVATLSITQNAGSTTPTYTYDFYLSPSVLTLDAGSGRYMYAMFVTYNNGVKISEVDVYTQCIWTIDDSDIASVSSNGYVTGIKSGYTYVNAEYNGFYAYSGVNVIGGSTPDEPDVETTYELKIDPSSLTVQVGSSTTANAVLYTYENGSLKTTQNVSASWSSNNTSIATVSGGTVTGEAEGTAQITAYYNGYYAHAPVDVTAKPVTVTYELEIYPSSLTVQVGSTASFTARYWKVIDGVRNGYTNMTSSCNWSSGNTSIATVSGGTVTGRATGNTSVTAMYGDLFTSASVNVIPIPEPDEPTMTYVLSVSPSTDTIQVGATTQLTATFYTYENGSLKSSQNVSASWSSNNTSIATVSGGTVTGRAVGNTQITASYNDHFAYADITVIPIPEPDEPDPVISYKFEVTPSQISVEVNSSASATAKFYTYEDGNLKTTQNVSASWSSNNTSIATVSGGTVTGRAVGSTTITASYQGYQASIPVEVVPKPVVTSYKLELSPSSISIRKGETGSFTATFYTYENGVEVSSQPVSSGVSWSSGNTSIATVSGGTVTGRAVGSTSVTAIYQGQSAVGNVYVTNAEVSYSLSLTPASTSITAGSGTSITAKLYTTTNGTTDSGRSVTSSCSWSSNDPSVATVSTSGYVSGVSGKYGTVDITASYTIDGVTVTGSSIVTVNYTYNYLELSASNVSLKVGDTYQLSATYYTVTNGVSSSVNVTSSAEWSGGSGYVSCNNSGLVTALQNSYNIAFSITASYGGKSASCGFVVNPAQQAYAISLSSTSGTFAANGASRSTTVTSTLNGSGTTWGASSSDSWISVSPVSGSNGASVTISVSKNSSTSRRYGSVTFATGPAGNQQTASYNITQMGQEVKTLSSISVSPTSVSNFSNQTSPITVTAYYTDGTSAVVTNNLTGHSTHINTAYYASGVIYHVNPGNATITISHTHNGVTKSASVSVESKMVVPVSIDLTHPYWMSRNSSVTVSAVATLSDGTTYSGPNINFNTSGTVTTITGQSGNTATISSGSSYGQDTIYASYTFNGTTVSDSGVIGVTN